MKFTLRFAATGELRRQKGTPGWHGGSTLVQGPSPPALEADNGRRALKLGQQLNNQVENLQLNTLLLVWSAHVMGINGSSMARVFLFGCMNRTWCILPFYCWWIFGFYILTITAETENEHFRFVSWCIRVHRDFCESMPTSGIARSEEIHMFKL